MDRYRKADISNGRRGSGSTEHELLDIPKEGIITDFARGSSLTGPLSRPTSVRSNLPKTPRTVEEKHRRTRTSSLDMDDVFSEDDTDLEEGPIDPTRQSIAPKDTKDMYCAACKYNRMTPIHEFMEQMGDNKIVLRHKSLGPKDMGPIVISLLSNLHVRELHLPDNNIGEKGINFITELMSENVEIKVLDISRNKLGQPGAVALGEIITVNDNLRELNASGIDLREKDVYYIVNAMQSNFTVKSLDLSHNEFMEDGGVLLGHMLEKNEGLTALDLSWNHLRLKGAIEICKGLAQNITLVHLDVSWNGFANEGAKAMSDALKINNTLESLDLTNNRINAIGASHLSKAIATNETLQVLRLGKNPISTIGALQILCAIRDNENSGIIEIDMQEVPVTYDFVVVIQEIQDKKGEFKITHGEFVTSPDVVGARLLSNDAMKIDPFKLLMVYAQKEGLRLWDVFAQFDKDGSMSISKDEFKHAIKAANIPITDKNLDVLVRQLDKDGDGEVDFGELVEFQKEYLLKERKRKAREAARAEEEQELLKNRQKKLGAGLKSLLPGGSEPLPRPHAEKADEEMPTLAGPTAERPTSAKLAIPSDELPQPTRPQGSAGSDGSAPEK